MESGLNRVRKKLLAKTNRYRKGGKEDQKRKSTKGHIRKESQVKQLEHKTVIFVEQTPRGELAKRLRELMSRISPILGFGIKVVERSGCSLKSQFPQSSLWEGNHCGRESCITCNQGADFITPCSRKSLVYENTCAACNTMAGSKEGVKETDPEIPSLYVGESSRTIQERGLEHWAAFKRNKKDSHIWKHQELQHNGEAPKFILRAISFHRSALSRQTAEAIRIRRRGGMGAVLNSKSEFNRCYIPRLRVVEDDEASDMEKSEEKHAREIEEEIKNNL